MTPQEIAALSREKKVETAMLRGLGYLPGDIAKEIFSLLTPTSLAVAVGSMVALGVAQAFGIGELADAVLLIAGLGFCGWGAIQGCEDLYHFIKTALGARTDDELNRAAHYFASAVVKLGVSIIMSFLLKKPLRRFQDAGGVGRFKTMNYRPNFKLGYAGQPPAPGTSVAVQYKDLGGNMGETDWFGQITIDSSLDADEARVTLNHELVHRFLMPKWGPFLQFRGNLRATLYSRGTILRYLEEALAEGTAIMREKGLKPGWIAGIHFPFDQGEIYLSNAQKQQVIGEFWGVLVVSGQTFTVSFARGLHRRPPAQQGQGTAQPQPAR